MRKVWLEKHEEGKRGGRSGEGLARGPFKIQTVKETRRTASLKTDKPKEKFKDHNNRWYMYTVGPLVLAQIQNVGPTR
jgi:hypothetical protein